MTSNRHNKHQDLCSSIETLFSAAAQYMRTEAAALRQYYMQPYMPCCLVKSSCTAAGSLHSFCVQIHCRCCHCICKMLAATPSQLHLIDASYCMHCFMYIRLSCFCVFISRHQSPSVLVPALRTVGNIVTGDDMQTQIIINCGALPCLLNLLQTTHKKSIKKEACWTLSNITAGTKDQIQAVLDAGIVPPLVHLLATAEFDIKKESAWAISNATSGGTREQIKYLVQAGCIRPLCDLLTCTDTRIVSIALEGLENILKVHYQQSACICMPWTLHAM